MNVPDYLKELLLQYNEVSVPGLGAFSMVRKNAAYNEKEGKFYPPYHQVKFNPQPKDDNLFIKYLAQKKNILFDTAKYIVEKFVSALIEQASLGTTAFADIGWFSKNNNELVFKPNDKLVLDPSFYGYTPIAMEKLTTGKPKPVYVAPVPVRVAAAEVARDEPEEIEPEQDATAHSHVSGWFIFLMFVISVAVIVFCSCLLFPPFANRLKTAFLVVVHNKTDDTIVSKKKLIPILEKKNETVTDTADASVQNAKKSEYAVIVASFRTWPSAQAEVRRLKTLGLTHAQVQSRLPGSLIKISVFTASSPAAADSALKAIAASGKISEKTSHIALLTPQ